MSDDDARRERALARKSWPVVRTALRDPPVDDLSHLTPAERVAMVWRLTQDAWATLPWPSFERSEAPGRVVRRHERAP